MSSFPVGRRAILIPLLLGALAVIAFATTSLHDAGRSEAAHGASMTLSVGDQTGKADILIGSTFKVSVIADAAPVTDGYILAQAWLEYGATGLIFKDSATTWPDCEAADLATTTATSAQRGCLTGLIDPSPSFYKGELFTFSFNCPNEKGSHMIDVIPAGTAPANTNGALFVSGVTQSIVPHVQGIDINCVNPPTATEAPPAPLIPRMSKSPALSNHWLMRQGAKIPPADCLAGTPTTLTEALSQEIATLEPKIPISVQQLAAFEFEVHYDNKKVCVTLTPGVEFEGAGAVCIVEDANTKPQLEGVARIGCVTIGKGYEIDELVPVAQVDVYPQPEIYSQAKPNQNNGVVVQLSNVNCDVGDEQGHAIPIFSCDDANITFRYLEGDVEPDCVIDAVDAQAIAFRWGVEKGSLIYNEFLNLEPSGAQADTDIDINDLQFVFGRFGSTCEQPHPPQLPQNPTFATPTPASPPGTNTPEPTSTPTAVTTNTPTATPCDGPCPTPTPTPSPTPCDGPCPTPTFTPTPGPDPEMLLNIKGGDCDDANRPTTCNVALNAKFTLSIDAPSVPANGYIATQMMVDYGPHLVYKPAVSPKTEIVWPDCLNAAVLHAEVEPSIVYLGCLTGLIPPLPVSTYTGNLFEISLTCSGTSSTTVATILPLNDPIAGTSGALFIPDFDMQVIPDLRPLTINCGP
jgi:hypothetical protein